MQKHIHVSEAIHNAAASLREYQGLGQFSSDAKLASANMMIAIRRGHEQAAAFWSEVSKFCMARDRAGLGTAIIIERHSIG